VTGLHQFFGQSQADAAAFTVFFIGAVRLVKTVEEFIQLFFWDERAGVGDGDFYEIVTRNG
jgi:hypothetical protein